MNAEDFDAASAAWMANKIRRGHQVVYRCTVEGCRRSASSSAFSIKGIIDPFRYHLCRQHSSLKSVLPTQPAAKCSPVAANQASDLITHEDVLPEEVPVLHVIDASTTIQTEAPPVLRRSRRLKQLSASVAHELPVHRRPVRRYVGVADGLD